jgi:hypothetical protein
VAIASRDDDRLYEQLPCAAPTCKRITSLETSSPRSTDISPLLAAHPLRAECEAPTRTE